MRKFTELKPTAVDGMLFVKATPLHSQSVIDRSGGLLSVNSTLADTALAWVGMGSGVHGNCVIDGRVLGSRIYGSCHIAESGVVEDSVISGECVIFGYVKDSSVRGKSTIEADCYVYDCAISGQSSVEGEAVLKDCVVSGNSLVSGASARGATFIDAYVQSNNDFAVIDMGSYKFTVHRNRDDEFVCNGSIQGQFSAEAKLIETSVIAALKGRYV